MLSSLSRRLALAPLCLTALPAAAATARIDEARLVGSRLEVRRHDAAEFVTAAAGIVRFELDAGQIVFASNDDELGAELYTLDEDGDDGVRTRLVASGVTYGLFHLDAPRLFFNQSSDGELWRRASLEDGAEETRIGGSGGLSTFVVADDRVVLTNDDTECRYWHAGLESSELIVGDEGECRLDTFDGTTLDVLSETDDGRVAVRTFDVELGRYRD
jgi:hypothetical protein